MVPERPTKSEPADVISVSPPEVVPGVDVGNGLSFNESVQLAMDASVVPHVVAEIKNSAGETVAAPSVMGAASLLVTVTVCASDLVPCAVDAKLRDAGSTDGGVGAAKPVPLRVIMVGEVGALDTIVTVPDIGPGAVGAKMRFSIQEAAGARLIGTPVLGAPPAMEPNPHQCAPLGAAPPVVSGKKPGLLCEMLLSESVEVPLLVMLTV